MALSKHLVIAPWLRRYWALMVAGLLVLFIAGGASMAHFARDRSAPPPVSAPPR